MNNDDDNNNDRLPSRKIMINHIGDGDASQCLHDTTDEMPPLIHDEDVSESVVVDSLLDFNGAYFS